MKSLEKEIKRKSQFFKNKKFSASDLHKMRLDLEKKYGEKIVIGTIDDMITIDEKVGKVAYDVLTKNLGEMSEDIKRADSNYVLAIKRRNSFKKGFQILKMAFPTFIGILLILAILKYLLN